MFTDRRLSKEEPGYTPAASPRLRRRPSPWPPAPAVVTSEGVAHPRARRVRAAPSPDPPGSSWWDILGGFTHRFLAYSFSSCSPGPPPSGGAGPPRLCQGRLPPSPAPPGSGCPQLHQPAATDQRWRSLTPTRSTVRSTRGALPALPLVGFPGSPPEPGVHLSAHRALHKSRRANDHLHAVLGHGVGMRVPR